MEAILEQPEEKWEPTFQFYAHIFSGQQFPNVAFSSPVFIIPLIPLGNIIKFYQPPGYGAGVHEEFADNVDYILRYTITVIPPPNLNQKKTVLYR